MVNVRLYGGPCDGRFVEVNGKQNSVKVESISANKISIVRYERIPFEQVVSKLRRTIVYYYVYIDDIDNQRGKIIKELRHGKNN